MPVFYIMKVLGLNLKNIRLLIFPRWLACFLLSSLLLSVGFSFLFSFLLGEGNKFNNANAMRSSSLRTSNFLNTTSKKEFVDDSSNVASFSLKVYRGRSKNISSLAADFSRSESFPIFSTPSEKYLGYYLQHYFNLSPIRYSELSASEKQQYQTYIQKYPDKEYLNQHRQELEDEANHPAKYQKPDIVFTYNYFRIRFYDGGWGVKINFDSVFLIDAGVEIGSDLALVILYVLFPEVSEIIHIFMRFSIAGMAKMLGNFLKKQQASYENGVKKFDYKEKDPSTFEVDYKQLFLLKGSRSIYHYSQKIYQVWKGYRIDLLFCHLHFIGWKWWVVPIFELWLGHLWVDSEKSLYYHHTNYFTETYSRDSQVEPNPTTFSFSFKNYLPSEILRILELNSNLVSEFILPAGRLHKKGILLEKVPSKDNCGRRIYKNNVPLFRPSTFARYPLLKSRKTEFNRFFWKGMISNQLKGEFDNLNHLKVKLKELDNLFKRIGSEKDRQEYLEKAQSFFSNFSEFRFKFVPSDFNSENELALKLKAVNRPQYRSFLPSNPNSPSTFSFSAVHFFLNRDDTVDFINFDSSSLSYLICYTGGYLIPQYNNDLLYWQLLKSPSFVLKNTTLNFLDWYGNFEVLNVGKRKSW